MQSKDLVIHTIHYYDGGNIYKLPERVKTATAVLEWLEDVTYYVSGSYIKSTEIEHGNLVINCMYEGMEEEYPFRLVLEVMKRKDNCLYVEMRLEQYVHSLFDEILWMKFIPDLIVKGEMEEVCIPYEEYRPSYD
jgi:hypothetical protein